MADNQQIQNAERFRKLLKNSDGITKSVLLNGDRVEIARALKNNPSQMELSQIVNDRNDYYRIESEVAAKVEDHKETEKDKLDKSTSQSPSTMAGGAAGIVTSPFGVASKLANNSDLYSEKRLESKADKYAQSELNKTWFTRLVKNVSTEERDALFDKHKMAFYENYLKDHHDHALQLAKTSTNPYLLAAIENENNRKAAMSKKQSLFQRTPIFQRKIISQTPPTTNENAKKDFSSSAGKLQSKQLIGSQTYSRPGPVTETTGKANAPKSSKHAPSRSRFGRGNSGQPNKISNPISLLKRFAPTAAIIGGIVVIMFITMVIMLLGIGVSPVAGGTSTSNGSGSGNGIGEIGGIGVTPLHIDGPGGVKEYIHIVDGAGTSYTEDHVTKSGQTISDPRKNFIYETFALPLGSAGYRKLLSNSNGTPRHINVYFYDPLGDSGAGVTGGGNYSGGETMRFWGFFEYKDAKSGRDASLEHILVHESGHVIQRRGLWPSGFSIATLSSQDNACYDNEWLKSYAFRNSGVTNSNRKDPTTQKAPADCSYIGADSKSDESGAEALANNVYCAPGKPCDYANVYCSAPIVYNGSCNATYDWIRTNIFGGDDFFAPTPPKTNYTFVALGDSLTAWPCDPATFGCVDSHPWGSYDFTGSPWPTQLTNIDTNLILKHNGGLPAKTSAYIESQFSAQVTPFNPDVLFVLAGTNDTGSIDTTINNLNKIIADSKTITSIQKVILLTIPHQCAVSGYSNLNNRIKGLASNYSPVIDISGTSVLTCSDFQPSDRLHLTDSGAKKLAQYIDGQIKSRGLLPVPAQPTSNFHLYCQYNYKTSACDISSLGCAPTSMAMVLTTFGDITTPTNVGIKYGMGCTSPTSYDQIKNALNSLKPKYAVAELGIRSDNLNPTTLKTYLSEGYYIIAGACMKGGYSGAIGHTTVITSSNSDGTFNDADPTWKSPPSNGCSTDTNIHMRTLNITYPGPDLPAGTPCSSKTGMWGGWTWAFAVKKQ